MIRIKELSIKNFRSLKDIQISDLNRPASVFHGPNNSGKSNILMVLPVIFSRKMHAESIKSPDRTTPFWLGSIRNFSDNFYMGKEKQIGFSVKLELVPAAFEDCFHSDIKQVVYQKGSQYQVCLEGTITQNGLDGEMKLDLFKINDNVAYRNLVDGEQEWFPDIENVDTKERQNSAEAALRKFDNLVSLVPANRYLTAEKSTDGVALDALCSEKFKSWFHSLSLSRENYEVFLQICSWFDEEPFKLGKVSFLKEDDELELMIEDCSGFRMPIASKGSGIQQMLVLLGYIAGLDSPIICIEEPELNLSTEYQKIVISKLIALAENNEFQSSQILISSHSDQIGSIGDLKRFHVENPGGSQTLVRVFTSDDRARLWPNCH